MKTALGIFIFQLFVALLIILLITAPMADYVLDYWISAYKKTQWESPYYLQFICGIFGPIVLISWVATLVCDAADIPENHPLE